jgi:hypothetical protein
MSELVASLWTRVQLPDRLHFPSELINTIHKNPGFKIKTFLTQSLADSSMTVCVMWPQGAAISNPENKFAALTDTFRGAWTSQYAVLDLL